jgi:cytochrome c oxidase subunit 3
MTMAKVNQTYYVPDQSRWPIIGAIALFFLALGAGHLVNEVASGQTGFGRYLMMAGVALLAFMLFGWFRHIIRESMTGLYSAQMDRSFRQGMVWFIFSEVMLSGFFGVLFYARQLAVPWLDGAGHRVMTGQLLWPDFTAHWPLLKTPGGATTQAMPWQGSPHQYPDPARLLRDPAVCTHESGKRQTHAAQGDVAGHRGARADIPVVSRL